MNYKQLLGEMKKEFDRYDIVSKSISPSLSPNESLRECFNILLHSNSILIDLCEKTIGLIQNKPQFIKLTDYHLQQLDSLRASSAEARKGLKGLDEYNKNSENK